MESLSGEEKEVLGILMELPQLIAQREAMPGGPQWGGKRKRSVPISDQDRNPHSVAPPPFPREVDNGGEGKLLRLGKPDLPPVRHVFTIVRSSPLDLNMPPVSEEECEKSAVLVDARKHPVIAVSPPLPKEAVAGEPFLRGCHVSTVATPADARRMRKLLLLQAKKKRAVSAKEKADVLAEKRERKKRDLLLAMWRENPALARDLNICYPLQ